MLVLNAQEAVLVDEVKLAKQPDGLFHPPHCFKVFNCQYADPSRSDCCLFALAVQNSREGEALRCFAFRETKCFVERNCDICSLKVVLAHDIIVGAQNFLQRFRVGQVNICKR